MLDATLAIPRNPRILKPVNMMFRAVGLSVQTSDRKTASPLKKPLERGKSCRVSGEAVAKAFNQVRGPHPSNIRIPMTRQTQSGLFPQKQHPRYSENPPSMFHSHLAVGLTSTEILGFQLESVTDSHWAVSLWDTNMFQAGPGPTRQVAPLFQAQATQQFSGRPASQAKAVLGREGMTQQNGPPSHRGKLGNYQATDQTCSTASKLGCLKSSSLEGW